MNIKIKLNENKNVFLNYISLYCILLWKVHTKDVQSFCHYHLTDPKVKSQNASQLEGIFLVISPRELQGYNYVTNSAHIVCHLSMKMEIGKNTLKRSLFFDIWLLGLSVN